MDLNHLVSGAVYGFGLAIVAIAIPRFTRHVLAGVLGITALIYVVMALYTQASGAWLAVELAGVGIYGFAAVRGFRGSAWWLVAGWAMHPVWDIALHFAGPGRGVAPAWYPTWCTTFDLMVAGFSAIAILIGTQLTDAAPRRPALSPVRASSCSCTCESCTATGARAA